MVRLMEAEAELEPLTGRRDGRRRGYGDEEDQGDSESEFEGTAVRPAAGLSYGPLARILSGLAMAGVACVVVVGTMSGRATSGQLPGVGLAGTVLEAAQLVATNSDLNTSAPAPALPTVLNYGADCWADCNAGGVCPGFCGAGNACCRYMSTKDPAECTNINWLLYPKSHHTCVQVAQAVVDVLAPVQQDEQQPAQPAAARNNSGPPVENYGADCWVACGTAGGACPGFCGAGNACCRYLSTQDPPECTNVDWLLYPKSHHTCVQAVNAISDYVDHQGQDCWEPCNGNGYCEWCGPGNACCRYGATKDPAECIGVTHWPAHDHHTCVKASGKIPGTIPSVVQPNGLVLKKWNNTCSPGMVVDAAGGCVKASGPALMTFYMYRATSDDNYHVQNANLGNLEGVLWYLHNEVVHSCPRKFQMSRIIRYVVTMKNPETLFSNHLHFQFGQMVMFDSGKCTWNNSQCSNLWDTYGHVVGCQPMNTKAENVPNYAGPNKAVWYSLPGKCSNMTFDEKLAGCEFADPGGECEMPDGSPHCTWKAEYAGEVRLDELSGITGYNEYCAAGELEYNLTADKGNGTMFWNNRRSLADCMKRVEYVEELFKMKYPNYPDTLGEPECDWWR